MRYIIRIFFLDKNWAGNIFLLNTFKIYLISHFPSKEINKNALSRLNIPKYNLQDIIPADGKLYLLFALMFKDLRQHIDGTRQQGNHLSSDIIRSYTLQILQGLDYCHKRRLFHRDLKPQNILLDEVGGLKLGDFGLAKLFGTPVRITTFEIATLRYRAPELLLEFPDYGPAIDIWSVGCVLAEMIQLTPFFKGTNPLDQIQRIFSILGTPRESSWPGISSSTIYQDISYSIEQTSSLSQELSDASQEQINLLSQLFCFYPKSRISAEEALKHQYFTEILSSRENNAASS